MKYTDNLKLQKPENGDFYNLEVFNTNADIIDKAIDEIEVEPNDVLEKLKEVDGEGSGLNADLLDGKDSTDFATAEHTHAMEDINNLELTAENTTTKDTDNNFTSETVEGALKELADKDKTLQTNIGKLEIELGTNKTTLASNINSIREVL